MIRYSCIVLIFAAAGDAANSEVQKHRLMGKLSNEGRRSGQEARSGRTTGKEADSYMLHWNGFSSILDLMSRPRKPFAATRLGRMAIKRARSNGGPHPAGKFKVDFQPGQPTADEIDRPSMVTGEGDMPIMPGGADGPLLNDTGNKTDPEKSVVEYINVTKNINYSKVYTHEHVTPAPEMSPLANITELNLEDSEKKPHDELDPPDDEIVESDQVDLEELEKKEFIYQFTVTARFMLNSWANGEEQSLFSTDAPLDGSLPAFDVIVRPPSWEIPTTAPPTTTVSPPPTTVTTMTTTTTYSLDVPHLKRIPGIYDPGGKPNGSSGNSSGGPDAKGNSSDAGKGNASAAGAGDKPKGKNNDTKPEEKGNSTSDNATKPAGMIEISSFNDSKASSNATKADDNDTLSDYLPSIFGGGNESDSTPANTSKDGNATKKKKPPPKTTAAPTAEPEVEAPEVTPAPRTTTSTTVAVPLDPGSAAKTAATAAKAAATAAAAANATATAAAAAAQAAAAAAKQFGNTTTPRPANVFPGRIVTRIRPVPGILSGNGTGVCGELETGQQMNCDLTSDEIKVGQWYEFEFTKTLRSVELLIDGVKKVKRTLSTKGSSGVLELVPATKLLAGKFAGELFDGQLANVQLFCGEGTQTTTIVTHAVTLPPEPPETTTTTSLAAASFIASNDASFIAVQSILRRENR